MQMSLATIRRGLIIGACLFILTPCVFAQESKNSSADIHEHEITSFPPMTRQEGLGARLGNTITLNNAIDDAVLFSEITRWTIIKWAAQAAFAPETLKHVVPMYAYQIDGLSEKEEKLSAIFEKLGEKDAKNKYIAILPPRQGGEEKPAACGFPVVNFSSKKQNGVLPKNNILALESALKKDGLGEGLLNYSNCHVSSSQDHSWYIAIPSDLNDTVFGNGADATKIWTKTGPWQTGLSIAPTYSEIQW